MTEPRARLLAERRAAEERLAMLRGEHRGFVDASRDTNADDEHDPEGATIAFEREQVGSLVRRTEQQLADIAAAMERLEAGGYGTCVTCGRSIPAERLAIRPAAATCVGCATSAAGSRRS